MRLKSTSKPTYKSIIAAVIANPWSLSIGLCAVTAVAAYAQATILPASPASPQTQSVTQALPQQSGLITLDFRDVPVVQLITMIAQQGNVGIIIGPDVDDKIVIPYINLKDETPQDAIKKATMSAGLRWQKLDDKTYMVGKTLPDLGDQNSQKTTRNTLPDLPFGQSGNRTPSASSLPDIVSELNQSGGNVYTPMPKLYQDGGDVETVDRDKPSMEMITVHNVRPDIIAYWIDPAHHRKPPEYVAADQGIAHAINPYPARPAVDPNITAQIQGNVSGAANPYSAYNPYNSNPYANPYQPTASLGYSQFNTPYTQGSAQFGGNRGGGGNNRGGGGGRGGGSGSGSNSQGSVEAPKGIGTIISIDAQNALLVYGTADGVSQLRQIIDFLDRPIRQVEIEAQFVDVGTTDAKAFGLSVNSRNSDQDSPVFSNLGSLPATEGGSTISANIGSYRATLRALVTNKKARIVNSPRVTTLNNLTATLFSSTSTPIVLSSSTSGIGGQVGNQQNAFFLTTSIGLVVTPTINNDDTITVFLTPQVQVQTPVQTTTGGGGNNNNGSNNSAASSIPSFTSQYLTTVATVKDGDTIVLGGLRTKNVSYTENSIPILSKIPIIGGLFKSKQKNDDDRELVIFLTARILHRTDDLAPLPGT